MMIKSANYIKGGTKKDEFPLEIYNEFMFCGRSNVGKSSIINMILDRKNLAYISSKPGKTQVINFYNINNEFYLVDVPGYGYASINKGKIAEFGRMFENYIETRTRLKIIFLLVDSKVGPTDDDITMYKYLKSFNKKVVIIATKKDKLNQSELYHSNKNILEKLNINPDELIFTSAAKKFGKTKILDIIQKNL